MRLVISPGSMGAVKLAIDLFGLEQVDPGSWLSPVWVEVNSISESDLEAAKELLKEYGLTISKA